MDHNDHIVGTTYQWNLASYRERIIPRGTLCIELVEPKITKITIGAGPTTGGGGCVVTSGFIQITSGSSGKYNITAGRKTQTATMTSSGWSISSPSWTPLITAVYGIK